MKIKNVKSKGDIFSLAYFVAIERIKQVTTLG